MNSNKKGDAVLNAIQSDLQFPINTTEFEEAAKKVMDFGPYGYVRSGAGGEETLRKNTAAFSKYSLVPQFLNDVSTINASITLFGRTYPQPFLFAPVGMNKLAHEEGEIAASSAAATYNIPFIQSTVSSYTMEEVKEATGDSPKWFQLYWSSNKEIALNMAKRAEKAGYEAIVLTVDTVMMGWREEDMRNQYSPLKLGLGKANFIADEIFVKGIENLEDETVIQGILDSIHHPTLSWDDIAQLRKQTTLPILLKGILHPKDAALAVEKGIDGIIVSNHGGRQLDGVISSLEALPAIVEVVNGKIPVLLDSGIRRGSDVVKAIALGADAVLLGRPYIYALAAGGQAGVEHLISSFIQEIHVSMGLIGAANIEQLGKSMIVKD